MASMTTKPINATKKASNALPGKSGKGNISNVFNASKDYTLNLNGKSTKPSSTISSMAKSSSSLGFGSQYSTKSPGKLDRKKPDSLFGNANVYKAIDTPKDLKLSSDVDKKGSLYTPFKSNDISKNIYNSYKEVKPPMKRSDFETKNNALTKNKMISVEKSTPKTNAYLTEKIYKKDAVSVLTNKSSTIESGLKTNLLKVSKSNSHENSVKKVSCATIKAKDDFDLNKKQISSSINFAKVAINKYDSKSKEDVIIETNKNNYVFPNFDSVPNKSDTNNKNQKTKNINTAKISIDICNSHTVSKNVDNELSRPLDIIKLNKRKGSDTETISKVWTPSLAHSICPETSLKNSTEKLLSTGKSDAALLSKSGFIKDAKETKENSKKLEEMLNMNSKKRVDVPVVFSKPKEQQRNIDINGISTGSDYTNSATLVIGMRAKNKAGADKSFNNFMEHIVSDESTERNFKNIDNEKSILIPKDQNNPPIIQNRKSIHLDKNNDKLTILKNESRNRKHSDVPQTIIKSDIITNSKVIHKNGLTSNEVKSRVVLDKDMQKIMNVKVSADIASENYSPSYSASISSKTRKSKFSFGIIWIPLRKRNKRKDIVYKPHNEDYCHQRTAFTSNMSGDSPDNQPYKKEVEETEFLVPKKDMPVAAASSLVAAVEAPMIEGLPTIPEEKQELIMHIYHDKELDKDGAGDSQDRERETKEEKDNYTEDSIKAKSPSKSDEKLMDTVDGVLYSPPTKPSSNITAEDESCGMKCLYYTLQCCDCVLM